MATQVIEVGEKLHVITRRLFKEDIRRHFVGEVTKISNDLQEMRGYVFVFNSGRNEFKKRPELRIRIFSLGQANYIVNKIPLEVVIESLEYRMVNNRLAITDNRDFSLDINEFGYKA